MRATIDGPLRAAALVAVWLPLLGGGLHAQGAGSEAGAAPGRVAFGAEGIVAIPGEELADFADIGFGVAPFLEYSPDLAWRLTGRFGVALHDGETSGDRDWTTFSLTGGAAYDLLARDPATELSAGLAAGFVVFSPEAPTRSTQPALDTDTRLAAAAGLRFARFLSGSLGLRLSGTVIRTLPGDDVAGPDSSWLTSLGAGIVVRP